MSTKSTMISSFYCAECGDVFKNTNQLSIHVRKQHRLNGIKSYYDLYFKNNSEGICKSCGKPTNFRNILAGYQTYCSHKCCNSSIEFRIRVSETIKSESWQNHKKQVCLEKYGVDSYSKTPEFKSKYVEFFKRRISEIEAQHNCTWLNTLIEQYGLSWYTFGIGTRLRFFGNVFIPNTDIVLIEEYSNGKSIAESFILEHVKKVYSGKILTNVRRVIGKLELDLYIPDLKIAIEYNSNYWHRHIEEKDNQSYHLNKSLLCRDKGIRLIHIYEFEDLNHQVYLLKQLILGKDLYPKKDFNKNNLLRSIPKQPEIVYNNDGIVIYGAGILYPSKFASIEIVKDGLILEVKYINTYKRLAFIHFENDVYVTYYSNWENDASYTWSTKPQIQWNKKFEELHQSRFLTYEEALATIYSYGYSIKKYKGC